MEVDYLKGKTIVLEGLDACGKGSVSKYLCDLLGHHGLKVKVYEYVNCTELAKPLRELMFNSGIKISERQRELLYSAIASETISLATQYRKDNPEAVIILDRSVISMMAFQSLSEDNSMQTVSKLYSILCSDEDSIGINYDDIFYLKITPETSIARCPRGCDYQSGIDKLDRVCKAYNDIFDYNIPNYGVSGALYELLSRTVLHTINAEQSTEKIVEIILDVLYERNGYVNS